MNSTAKIPVKQSQSGITISIKVSGSLPNGGSDGQVLIRQDGKPVWGNCPTSGESVSAESIKAALGYTPADNEQVIALFEQLRALILENGGSNDELFNFSVNERGEASISGATLQVNENGKATLAGVTLAVGDDGNAVFM